MSISPSLAPSILAAVRCCLRGSRCGKRAGGRVGLVAGKFARTPKLSRQSFTQANRVSEQQLLRGTPKRKCIQHRAKRRSARSVDFINHPSPAWSCCNGDNEKHQVEDANCTGQSCSAVQRHQDGLRGHRTFTILFLAYIPRSVTTRISACCLDVLWSTASPGSSSEAAT
ncbi:hypothetical protein K458DRAFT_2335 [Lentithecium fluviatile CBS 122367]|uniref:Uncharacterized protein n=1 Tax=Lentithecium fluviatile CBS 122367 TaxID=1168545 RepID=A0A6G1JMA8_9PLEO|nr:hypothetical protein K458DRAFT_2335 [Lentithecium fluviatile CBS 122367]